jgi:preprotein translocase subunit SecG
MATLVTVIHVFVCLFLVLTVLLQPGKGGGMGGAFGGGSTQGVFGGSGGSSLLRKATVFIAAIFMLSSMTLAWLGSNTGADALKQFSASERAKLERRESLRQAVLEGAEGVDLPIIDESQLGEDAPEIEPGAELSPEDLDLFLDEAAEDNEAEDLDSGEAGAVGDDGEDAAD